MPPKSDKNVTLNSAGHNLGRPDLAPLDDPQSDAQLVWRSDTLPV